MSMDLLNKNRLRRWSLFAFCALIAGSIIFNCSPKTRYQVLSFFFDGVPNPEEQARLAAQHQASDSLNQGRNRQLSLQRKKEPPPVFHPPFADRDCEACHNIRGGNRLNSPVPELCFECHDDFRQEYAALHGPVAAGACTECHHPHVAKIKKLLKRKGQALCLYCHDKKDVFKNDAHEDLGDMACTECHNAHGGDEPPFLE